MSRADLGRRRLPRRRYPIKDRTIGHKKLALNTVTGAEVSESTLGRVPNADKLDGLDSGAFVKGAGVRVYQAKRTGLADSGITNVTLLTLPGLGRLDVVCTGDQLSWMFTDTTLTVEHGTTVSGDNASLLAQYVGAGFGPSTSGNNNMTFFHDNTSAPDAGFTDDIAIINSDSHHTSGRILLSGVTDVGGNSTCDAQAVASVY